MIKKYFAVLLLAGCTLTPQKTPPVSMYDFGPTPQLESGHPVFLRANIQVAEISAPVWLDTQSIRYRLAYHNPAQTYAYTSSRWVAPPAKLLTERIKQHFATHIDQEDKIRESVSLANYLLKIELEEFIQIFENQNSSWVKIRLRVSLYEQKTRSLMAQRNFLGEQLTESTDAEGAVAGLIKVGDGLSSELIQWIDNVFKQQTYYNDDINERPFTT
jgi:cholesterol transport system auxiliary component